MMNERKGKNEKFLEVVFVALTFLISFLLKFYIILNIGLSPDYGAYLKWADVLRGFDVVGNGLRYPPIYPIMLSIPLLFLNEITALTVCAAFIFSVIVFPYYLLARKMFGRGIFPVISSLLIVFNVLYSEMIAWGGNANMLAFVFLVVFLIFWINCIRDVKSAKDKLFAAFFISLTVGSHYLAAVYLLLFFLFFLLFLLALWCKNRRDKAIVNVAKSTLTIGLLGSVLCIPYIPSYTYILNSTLLHETNFSLADQLVRSLDYLLWLRWENLFTAILLFLGIIGVIVLTREDKMLGLTLAALFISGCLPIFFTPHPARWVYFWPIPLFLGAPVLAKKSFSKLRDFNKFVKLVSLACLTVLIFTSIFASFPRFFEATSYYRVLTPQVLDALNYLRNSTPEDSIIATSGPYRRGGEGSGHCYGWWIEGYADRRSVATSYLRFLSYYDEREVAKNANILFSGSDVLMNDFVMVAETFPAGVGNPEISINIGDFYDRILFFADNQTIIVCCQNMKMTLSSIKETVTYQNDGVCPSINISYNICNSPALVKNIRILSDSTVEVSFKILQANITKIFMPLFKSDFVDLLNSYFKRGDRKITFEMVTSMGAYVRLNMTIDYRGTFNAYVGQVVYDKLAMLVFDNPPENAEIRLSFALPKLVNEGSSQVHYFNAYKLIEDMGIDYILINVNRRREFEWFNRNKNKFSKVYENEEVAIFKVILH